MFLREFNNSAPQNKVNENFITDKLNLNHNEKGLLSQHLFSKKKTETVVFCVKND